MRTAIRILAALLTLTAASTTALAQSKHPALTDPSKATEKAPETFRAKFTTTKGDIVFECTRAWAPNGVDRFYNLVKIGFFDDIALFRVAKGFVVQWGIHGDPKVSAAWREANLPPDTVTQSNTRGMLTYAMAGRPDTRSTQLFVNYKDNVSLDRQGFAPICKVVEGMETADAFNGEYGERVTGMQGEIQEKGNAYLREKWPNLDYIKTAVIVGGAASPSPGPKSDGASSSQDSGTSNVPFIVGAAALAGLIYFIMRRKSPETEPSAVGEKRSEGDAKDAKDAKDAREKTAPKKKTKKKKAEE